MIEEGLQRKPTIAELAIESKCPEDSLRIISIYKSIFPSEYFYMWLYLVSAANNLQFFLNDVDEREKTGPLLII